MNKQTILASLAHPVLAAAREERISLRDVALPPPLQRPEGPAAGERIAHAVLFDLWRAAGERSRHPAFGLHVAERFLGPSVYGVVGFLARHSETGSEALEVMRRYGGLLKDDRWVTYEPRGGGVSVVAPYAERPPNWSRHGVESGFAAHVSLLRRWAARPDVGAARVEFRHEAPADPALYERFFGCEVRFSQPLDRLVLPASAVDARLATSDPELRAFFRAQAETAFGALPPRDDTRARLRHAVDDALPRGLPALGDVAAALAMSPRTLQRRLTEQGVSYHDVLDEARRDAALRVLASRRRALLEAAEAAGFRDQKSFRRAFRRWTGRSPSAYQLKS
ncbi:MAG TPA: AraC family transcriptional regulator ligand-binding domain-containing protein [Polyangiaceae bacterium]|nr:AraC family transcriptional regulator ligand-binding domain-containing protein [Polyangiaceae bacterium]